MRKLVYYIGLSIDGFIAGPDDQLDFYPMSDEYAEWMTAEFADALPTHLRQQLGVDFEPTRRFDTVVMGRRTYEPALREGITNPYAHLRQVVISRTLDSPDPHVTVVHDDPVAAVQALKQEETGLDIYLAGGGQLAGELMSEIDRLLVKLYPVVAGTGRTAFGTRFTPTRFDLDEVRTFAGGNALLQYSAAPDDDRRPECLTTATRRPPVDDRPRASPRPEGQCNRLLGPT